MKDDIDTAPTSSFAMSATPATAAAPHPSAATVDEWFIKHFHNSPLSGIATEFYNLAHAAKEELKHLLSKGV